MVFPIYLNNWICLVCCLFNAKKAMKFSNTLYLVYGSIWMNTQQIALLESRYRVRNVAGLEKLNLKKYPFDRFLNLKLYVLAYAEYRYVQFTT